MKHRLQLARTIKRTQSDSYWTKDIFFYFDATAFYYKSKPRQHAQTLRGRVWWKRKESLTFRCTAKGRKAGSGGKVVRVHAAISYGNGVVLAKPYKKLTGKRFGKFIKKKKKKKKNEGNDNGPRLFVQDGDPSQNSRRSMRALTRTNATVVKIPARSPDLNPIENIFHILGNQLNQDAIEQNIEYETFRAFRRRVVDTLRRLPQSVIDKTIASMSRRIDAVIQRKGGRLKY
ncbi:Transposable element Tcb2 transposase [Holothuria leucospilota]|uniref:Transposable element Tcb2 transposase n=1 Tax=Holothuria leucospilota TaxID=206669 RepID=A0A9Q1CPD2_HOLLE|nr:Transposable element Tcb2 transposase [Holothuria leucospilota]